MTELNQRSTASSFNHQTLFSTLGLSVKNKLKMNDQINPMSPTYRTYLYTKIFFTRLSFEHELWLICQPSFNSLAPGRPGCHFKTAIFNLVLLIGIFTSSKDNALRWMSRDLTDDKSTLVQVMAWCRQATSHYLSQCWPSPMSPPGPNELWY